MIAIPDPYARGEPSHLPQVDDSLEDGWHDPSALNGKRFTHAERVVHAQVGDVIDRMQYPMPPHNAPAELPALDPKSVSSGLSALVNRLGLRWPGQWS